MLDLEPSFDDCPRPCRDNGDYRNRFCDRCEVGRLERELRDSLQQQFDEFYSNIESTKNNGLSVENRHKWTVDNLIGDFRRVCALRHAAEGQPAVADAWTVTVHALINIVSSEINRRTRIADYNRKQEFDAAREQQRRR